MRTMTSLPCCLVLMMSLFRGSNSDIDGQKLADELNRVADAVGMPAMQKRYDDLQYMQMQISGPQMVQQISDELKNKFIAMESALNNIRADLESTYNSFTSTPSMIECCNAGDYEFDTRFRAKVSFDESCVAISASAAQDYKIPTQSLLNVFKDNYQKNPNLLWQYFGSIDGIYVNYPSTKLSNCGSYDPRFRPYFASAATPKLKDIVIVIDTSNSMSTSLNQKTLLQYAKEAAITVIETLNPEDRVGVVTFNDVVSTPGNDGTCFKDKLAFASYRNVALLKTFINSRGLSGKTNYEKALITAFAYFKGSGSTVSGESRDRMILFLSDGDNADGRDVLQVIKEENEQLNNSVIINTYGLSIVIKPEGRELLQNMSRQTLNSNAFGEVIIGQSQYITDPSELRTLMGSYYLYFSSQLSTTAIFSKPYVDVFSNIGLLLSMCLPVNVLGSVKGVACTDIKLSELASDITYFQQGDYSYAFMIDGFGNTLVHPLLPQLRERIDNSDVLGIENFEISINIEAVIRSMKMGQSGTQDLITAHIQSRGIMLKEGDSITYPAAKYSWSSVSNSNFSICVVTANISTQKELQPVFAPSFMYHNRAVRPGPYTNCRHFARFATTDQTAVMLTPTAFEDPDKYLDEEETESRIRQYEQYLTGQISINPGLKEYVLADVGATYILESEWKENQEIAKYMIWQYICTVHGVVRMYPGVQLTKDYDNSLRPWYIRSLANKGINVISPPYVDSWGSGYLITLSKVIYKGSTSGQHNSSNEAAAVMGSDFPINYFQQLLSSIYWQCNSTNYRCIVVDNSGFIVMHPHFVEATTDPNLQEMIHITSKESVIAKDLLVQGLLFKRPCLDIENQKQQYTYRLALRQPYLAGIDRTDSAGYELRPVPGSNIFIILAKAGTGSGSCCPNANISPDEIPCNDDQCYCLCYKTEQDFDQCQSKYTTDELIQPCSARIKTLDSISESEVNKIVGLPTCFDSQCFCRSSRYDCYSVAGCSWCSESKSGSVFTNPFCDLQETCPYRRCVADNCGKRCSTGKEEVSDKTNVGAIVGVVVGVIVVLAICAIVIFLVLKFKRQEPVEDDYLDAVPTREGDEASKSQFNPVMVSAGDDVKTRNGSQHQQREQMEIPELPPPRPQSHSTGNSDDVTSGPYFYITND